MEFLHPGVFIQEVSSGVQPIEGVSTSTTAFIGKAEKGPLNLATLVTSFTEFQLKFGGFLNDGTFLAHSALNFFNNGGKRLYVVRVAKDARTASVTLADRESSAVATLRIAASSPGAWANAISVAIADGTIDPANELKLTVVSGTTVLESFDNLSMDPDEANFVERAIGSGSQSIVVEAQGNDSTVGGTSVSDATAVTALNANQRNLVIDLDGDGPQVIALADPLTSGAEIATAIQNAVRALLAQRAANAAAYTGFTCTFAADRYTLTSGTVGKRSVVHVGNAAVQNAAPLLRLGSTNGGTETGGAAVLRPVNGTYALSGATIAGAVTTSTTGSDGGTPQTSDYNGGLGALDSVLDVNIVAIPGIGAEPTIDAGSSYCQNRQDCFFVADVDPTIVTPTDGASFVNSLTNKSSYGAVYFPWVKMIDPTGASPTPILVAPSGWVTGIYARIDARRGVWKAPAGAEANLGGAVGLAASMTDAQQDVLNVLGANLIRFFPSSGIVVWGTRTLATRSDPEYRYVPVRRLAIFLERSIYDGIQWAVFEPNDEPLWSSLRLNIGAFMLNQFRAGSFQGDTPARAFFVKCDSDTNPQSQIDAGIVTVLVGFAPVKPAEFVVIKISQKTASTT